MQVEHAALLRAVDVLIPVVGLILDVLLRASLGTVGTSKAWPGHQDEQHVLTELEKVLELAVFGRGPAKPESRIRKPTGPYPALPAWRAKSQDHFPRAREGPQTRGLADERESDLCKWPPLDLFSHHRFSLLTPLSLPFYLTRQVPLWNCTCSIGHSFVSGCSIGTLLRGRRASFAQGASIGRHGSVRPWGRHWGAPWGRGAVDSGTEGAGRDSWSSRGVFSDLRRRDREEAPCCPARPQARSTAKQIGFQAHALSSSWPQGSWSLRQAPEGRVFWQCAKETWGALDAEHVQ